MHIQQLADILLNDGYRVHLYYWYTPYNLSPNYPCDMNYILTELSGAKIFIGIAHKYFRKYTQIEWEKALSGLYEPTPEFHFDMGAIFFLADKKIEDNLKDDEYSSEFKTFRDKCKRSENGNTTWHPINDFEMNTPVFIKRWENVIYYRIMDRLKAWIIDNYTKYEVTKPLASAPEVSSIGEA